MFELINKCRQSCTKNQLSNQINCLYKETCTTTTKKGECGKAQLAQLPTENRSRKYVQI